MSTSRLATWSLRAVLLLAVPSLLALQPTVARTPIAGVWLLPWRLDALALVFLLGVWSAAPLLAPTWPSLLRAGALLLLLTPALLMDHLLLLPAALLAASLALRWWRWAAAALLLMLGTALLWLDGIGSWHDPAAGAALHSGIFLLLGAAVAAGLGVYPVALTAERFDWLRLALTPIWLLPLLRSLSWGPWNRGWAVALVLLGGASLAWAAASALWALDRERRIERISGVWTGLAVIATGLVTPVGALGALWIVLSYGLGMSLTGAAAANRRGWSVWAAPLPPSTAFVASWLVQGATAASGAFLLTAIVWFATLLAGLAIVRLWRDAPDDQGSAAAPLALVSIVVGAAAPLPLRLLAMPAVELLQGGLTPFGLFDIWPWVGIAALDSGQRRVAVLPSIAVMLLALVAGALIWLLGRLLGWSGNQAGPNTSAPWDMLRERVWWARGPRRRG